MVKARKAELIPGVWLPMKVAIITLSSIALAIAWAVFEAVYGIVMLRGRCDTKTFISPKAPVRVSGFFVRDVTACVYCSVEDAKAGYRFIEFEVGPWQDLDHVRRFYGITTVGFFRLTFEPRVLSSESVRQVCYDRAHGFERFRSSAWCPQLAQIAAPSSEYGVYRSLIRHQRFLGILNESTFRIEHRTTREVLAASQTYSWSPTGPVAAYVANPTAWPLGFGGAVCPEKSVPNTTKILAPLTQSLDQR